MGITPVGQPSVFNLECTNPWSAVVAEGRRSFPSGHSSFLFCFSTWIALYLAGKLNYFSSSRLSKTEHLLLIMAFPLLATLSAIGRTCDYKHHWEDVLCGSILGIVSAFIGYYQFYPRLTNKSAAISYIEQKFHEEKKYFTSRVKLLP